MDNMILYDFWIASQARNDGNTHRHCEEEKLRGTKQNPEIQQKAYLINNTEIITIKQLIN